MHRNSTPPPTVSGLEGPCIRLYDPSMASRGDGGNVSVRISDLPTEARGELVELGVRIDDAVELRDGWKLTVAEDQIGSVIALLVQHGAQIKGVDPAR